LLKGGVTTAFPIDCPAFRPIEEISDKAPSKADVALFGLLVTRARRDLTEEMNEDMTIMMLV